MRCPYQQNTLTLLKYRPSHDLITNQIIKHLPKKIILFLTFIFNSPLRLSHDSHMWKRSKIIMISKPRQNHPILFLIIIQAVSHLQLKELDFCYYSLETLIKYLKFSKNVHQALRTVHPKRRRVPLENANRWVNGGGKFVRNPLIITIALPLS